MLQFLLADARPDVEVELAGADYHYLVRVRRMAAGGALTVVDGAGTRYQCHRDPADGPYLEPQHRSATGGTGRKSPGLAAHADPGASQGRADGPYRASGYRVGSGRHRTGSRSAHPRPSRHRGRGSQAGALATHRPPGGAAERYGGAIDRPAAGAAAVPGPAHAGGAGVGVPSGCDGAARGAGMGSAGAADNSRCAVRWGRKAASPRPNGSCSGPVAFAASRCRRGVLRVDTAAVAALAAVCQLLATVHPRSTNVTGSS